MRFTETKTALIGMVQGIFANHLFIIAAALSYYFIISLFPALILLSAVIAYLPVSNASSQAFVLLSGFIPSGEMELIATILRDVIAPNRNALLSVGIIGTLWASSSGFAALMTAINIAYAAPDTRPFWKTRPIAIGLVFSVGALFLIAFGVMTVGPHFGSWLVNLLGLSRLVALIWPYVRWSIALSFAVIAVEVLYFIAPSVKQHFFSTLPGAIFAVASWLGLTYFLGIYFQSSAAFSKTYGSLGGVVAFMAWLYWAGFAVLVGAQLNAELEKVRRVKSTVNAEAADSGAHVV